MDKSRGGGFTVVDLPRDVALALAHPFPVLDLDSSILTTIDPNDPSRQPRGWHEFQFAPSMNMVRTPNLFTGKANDLLAPFTSDEVPPLELDQVSCKPSPAGSIIEANFDGTFPMPKLFDVPVLGRFSLARVRYDVSRLRLELPPASALPNSLSLGLTLRNVVGNVVNASPETPNVHVDYFVRIDQLAVACVASFGPPMGPCGNLRLACSVATVNITNLQHNLPVPITEEIVQDALVVLLAGGVTLHFEGFASTGLTVDELGRLTLSGERDDGCSHAPPPPPRPAPVRGLVRSRSTIGHGELLGSRGSVIPFDLLPELKVDWTWATSSQAFRPWLVQQPPDSSQPYRLLGAELPRPLADLPSGFKASVELVQHVQSNCWLKPVGISTLLNPLFPPGATRGRRAQPCGVECDCITCVSGAKFFLELVAPDGTSVLTRDFSVLPSGDRVVVEGVSAADLAHDVAPRLTRLDGQLCPGPNCPDRCGPGRCAPWVRLELVEDALPRFPIPGGGPPWEVVLWAGRSLEVLESEIGLTPRCPLTPMGPGTGETFTGEQRITQPASIVFGPMMADSAPFQSTEVLRVNVDGTRHITGFRGEQGGNAFIHTSGVDLSGGTAVKIELTAQCVAHQLGAPHLSAPCWSGDFSLPAAGTIALSEAFSGTTVGRIPLRALFDFSDSPLGLLMVATLGNRFAAVQGTLDRSGLQMFTRVPPIYNAIGLTPDLFDFRNVLEREMVHADRDGKRRPDGAAYLDWEHDRGTFSVPYAVDLKHPHDSQFRWLPEKRLSSYFADWPSDQLQLRWTGDEPFSNCPRPNQLFASPRVFTFRGAGLGDPEPPRSLPASDVLESGARGPAPEFHYRVGPGNPAAGRLHRVLP